jgi:formylglycine-generating enzyme required for sulfatase activity
VEQKLANPWGLMDMHGNVSEWCQDWYGDYAGGSVTDPQGPDTGSNRVLRGGSLLDDADGCRSAQRDSRDPADSGNYIGFRVVLAPIQP